MKPSIPSHRNRTTWLINTISILVPIVVALLLGIRTKLDLGTWTTYLPHVIGGINSLTAFLLVLGMVFIKAGRLAWHRYAMLAAFGFGGAFLVCYVTYHLSNPSTSYGGEGPLRIVYYALLLSHIGLSIVVLPLVLRALAYGLIDDVVAHRRVAKFAFPIWLYVSVSGVLVYWLISPYYQHGPRGVEETRSEGVRAWVSQSQTADNGGVKESSW